jgi:hypothetical protein
LAVDAALYQPMDVDSEGQAGVERTKGITRAVLRLVSDRVQFLQNQYKATTDKLRKRIRRLGTIIPEISPDKIEDANEVPMNLRAAFHMDEELAAVVSMGVQGTLQEPGLATAAQAQTFASLKTNDIQNYIREFFLTWAGSDQNNISELYMDGNKHEFNSHGRWVVRATSLESPSNLMTGTANGTNFGVYERGPRGQLVLRVGVQILWGSTTRVVVSYSKKTQDFILKGDGRLVENDRAGDDNSVNMAVKGSYLASGGISTERPAGFLAFDQQVERNINSSIRFFDSIFEVSPVK